MKIDAIFHIPQLRPSTQTKHNSLFVPERSLLKKLLRRRRRQRRLKMNLYFTNESRDTLQKSNELLRLSLSKLSRNVNLGHRDKFKILAVVVHVLQTTQDWSFHVALPKTAKKRAWSYNTRVEPLFWSLNLLFSGVAVAVVVFLNSLFSSCIAPSKRLSPCILPLFFTFIPHPTKLMLDPLYHRKDQGGSAK